MSNIQDNETKQISDKLRVICERSVELEYPRLNPTETKIIVDYLILVINSIQTNFSLIDTKKYHKQLVQNNYLDIRSLLQIILPFVEEKKSENVLKKNITSLNEIFVNLSDDSKKNNKSSPIFKYSTIQYQRCHREKVFRNQFTVLDKFREFKMEYLDNNVKLLLKTIEIIGSKLYVNWVDVLPIPLNSYQTYPVFQNFLTGKKTQDVYNIIHNELYSRVKTIKWLLYVLPGNSKNEIFTYLFFINTFLPLEIILNESEWNGLKTESQTLFKNKWLILLESFERKKTIISNNIEVEYSKLQQFLVDFLYFFQTYYSDNDETYEPLEFFIPTEDEKYNDPEEDIIKKYKITPSQIEIINKKLKEIDVKHIYSYLQNCIINLSRTWYGMIIFTNHNSRLQIITNEKNNENETKNQSNNYFRFKKSLKKTGVMIFDDTNNSKKDDYLAISFKNIYNFAEYFVRIENKNNKKILPEHWESLDVKTQELIKTRLDPENLLSWFNIQTNISKTYEFDINESARSINNLVKNIGSVILEFLPDIVVQTLIKKGSLSAFQPNPNLTNKTLFKTKESFVGQLQNKMEKHNLTEKKIKEYEKYCYYYPTENLYGSAELIRNRNWKKPIGYLQSLVQDKRQTWYDNYAMNWVSQINFFHKFIHTRVTFVTGATGVGKSTQIPKLYLYALRCIDYNFTGKVVCTQPRRKPTKNNALRIAMEMGLPIEQYSKKFDTDLESNLYYVQYKHKGSDSHVLSKIKNKELLNKNKKPTSSQNNQLEILNSYIKIETDGTFLEEIYDNPFLKKSYIVDGKTEFTQQNSYDVIIIDEAHEHNMRMDIILTLMRNAVYYNNKLRLVIMSATMQDDEDIFNRYYRDINDNRSFPLSNYLSEQKLDRINVGRRLHIAPPGMTTRFNIKEIYNPLPDSKDNKNLLVESEKLVVKICQENSEGDILLFLPGSSEIKKMCQKLNDSKLIDSHIIALPLYSDMHDSSQRVVTEITDYYKQLNYSKQQLFEMLTQPSGFLIEKEKVKIDSTIQYNYKRVIIVATNIAEASITIPSLKFVVDTGLAKINIYDPKTRSTSLKMSLISETNREQRKGRVGRVSSGKIYYLYKKDSRKQNSKLTKYEITRDNVMEIVFRLICTSINPDKIIDFDPNDINFGELIKTGAFFIKSITNKFIKQFILTHYCISGIFFDYYGNNSHYDYLNVICPPARNMTGYDLYSIDDALGLFYLTHPDENYLERDILGNIIKVNSKDADSTSKKAYNNPGKNSIMIYNSQKISKYAIHGELQELYFIVNLNDTSKKGEYDETKIIKTEYGQKMWELYRVMSDSVNTNFSIRDLITLIYSIQYKSDKEVVQILSGLTEKKDKSILNFVATRQTKAKKTIYKFEEFAKQYGNNSGDLETIVKIFDILGSIIEKIIKELSEKDFVKTLNDLQKNQEKLKSITDLYEPREFNSLVEYISAREINFKYGDLEFNKKISNDPRGENLLKYAENINQKQVYDKIEKKYEKTIKKTCELNNLNYDFIVKVIRNYILNSRYYLNIVKDHEIVKLFFMIRVNSTENKIHNVIKAFMHGYAGNTAKDGIKNLFVERFGTKVQIKTMRFLTDNLETTLRNIGSSIMFIERVPDLSADNDLDDEFGNNLINSKEEKPIQVSLISNIKPEWINETSYPIFLEVKVSNEKYVPRINKFLDSNLSMSKFIEVYSKKYMKDMRKTGNLVGGAIKTYPIKIESGNNLIYLRKKGDSIYLNPAKTTIKFFDRVYTKIKDSGKFMNVFVEL